MADTKVEEVKVEKVETNSETKTPDYQVMYDKAQKDNHDLVNQLNNIKEQLNAANETIKGLQDTNRQYVTAYNALNTKFENLAELYNLITERYLSKERPQK